MPKQKNNSDALSQARKAKAKENRVFSVILYLFFAMFLLMIGYFVYFMVFRSEDFINSPYNKRQDTFAVHVVRGSILSSDGQVLAETVTDENGEETRQYPYGSVFAHAVGYAVNGKSGIESTANFNLLRSHASFLKRLANGLSNEKNPGDQVITTLDTTIQQTAYNALGDYDGAVIVMEPSTGKILALVSKPDFDPNTIAEDWDDIVSDEGNSVLLNRATQGLYPPGSTFKIFTSLEYYREHGGDADYSYECTGSISLGDLEIHCANHSIHGNEDLISSFAMSCNTSYANVGKSLNRESFASLCKSLLFNSELPSPYSYKESSFTLTADSTTGMAMQTAIGQGETLVTPLHMALVTSAIANGGTLMEPYVIDHTENDEGVIVKEYEPTAYGVLMSSDESTFLQNYMRYVVTNGTAYALLDGNYTAYGKTGSAEYSSDKSTTHAWFTGYAQTEAKGTIVVTVIAEGGGGGSAVAVPIAQAVFDAYFAE